MAANDYHRYRPQMRLPEIGIAGQQRLAHSTVLIVGCGALGSPVAMYLAGAGVGNLVIADFDTVDESNLHRQVFYRESDVGKFKAELLKERILELNSRCRVEVWKKMVTRKMLEDSPLVFDCIVDAADNPSTTYMLDSFCKTRSIPFSTAGVSGWQAQIFTAIPDSPYFSDIVPAPEEDSGLLPCSIAGIAGPVAAFAASIQAAETLKILLSRESVKTSLTVANLLTLQINSLFY